MTRRLAVLAALSFALTACTEEPAAAPGGDPIGWADKVCSAVADSTGALPPVPNINPSTPQEAKDGMATYLGALAGALDRVVAGIRAAGAPPVSDGAQTVDQVTNTLADARRSIETAKANLEQARVNDPVALGDALTKAAEDLAGLGNIQDPTEGLETNAQLREAFAKAASCQRLRDGG